MIKRIEKLISKLLMLTMCTTLVATVIEFQGITEVVYASAVTNSVIATEVTLNNTSLSLVKGNASALTATIAPSTVTNKGVTWKSNNTAVAIVDSTGKVTAVGAGTVNITCTTTDGSSKSSTCSVTVTNSVMATGVTLNNTSLNVVKGNTSTLTATVAPSNATNKAVTWGSSNTSVATVDSTGNVVAVGTGIATITCTASDGSGKSATCVVTVSAKSDFTFDSTTGTITRYTGTDTTVVIPSTINGVSVKSIGQGAFNGCNRLISVTIPNSVTLINSNAFEYCSSLKNLNIPDNVLVIGSNAFQYCSNLASINFSNNSALKVIGSHAFDSCNSLTSVVIPNKVWYISGEAFDYCNNLKNITVPESLTTVDGNSFWMHCRNVMFHVKSNRVAKLVISSNPYFYANANIIQLTT